MFFILTVAAAESAIGLAILVVLFRNRVHASTSTNSTRSRAERRSMSHNPFRIDCCWPCRWRRWPAPWPALGLLAATRSAAAARTRVTILGVFVVVRPLGHDAAKRWRRRRALQRHASTTWMVVGGLKMEIGFLVDGLTAHDDVRGDLRLADGAHLHHRLHGRRPGLPALLQLHLAVHLLDADAGDEQQLPAAVLRLGSGGPGVLPADRLLVQRGRRRSSPT